MPGIFNWRRVLRLCVMLLGACLCTTAPAAEPLVVEVVPQFPAESIFRTWTPLLQKLGERTGLKFTLRIMKSIPEFEQSFVKGIPDIAYMNPYHAVMARRAQGYEPIVCDANTQLTGILLVRKDGPVRTLADLQGKQIAFPAPNAFGASLYLRALLSQEAKLDFSPHYVLTHTNVYRLVARGKYAAGGGVLATFEREPPALRGQLRVLYETTGVSPHPLVVHPRLDAALREKLQSAFLALGQDSANAKLLQGIPMPQPRAVTYADYRPLEHLGLEKYAVNPPSK